MFTPVVGSPRSLIQWTMKAIFPGVKGARRNPEQCLTSSVKVRISGVINPHPHMSLWCTLFFPVFCHANFIAVSRGSVLAFSTQVRGFKPGRSRRIFKGEKILSTPSFGGEVKPSVPCRRFAACKRSLNAWKFVISAKLPENILTHSSTFRR